MTRAMSEDVERTLLNLRYDGVIQQCHLERLGERLERHGPMAVTGARYGFSRDRPALLLADGTVLRMKLFWPVRAAVAMVCSLRWRDGVGWALGVLSPADQASILYAWQLSIVEPSA